MPTTFGGSRCRSKRLKGTRRSNVATYIGIMDDIRNLFAQTNYVKASIFSTNSEGTCPECNGMGTISTDLAFMDAIEVTCDAFNGSGYKSQVLDYLYNQKNISDVM